MTIFISHDNCYTFKRFLKDCGHVLRKDIRFIFYADLAYRKSLPNDLTLFTDLERLDEKQIELATTAENQLKAAGATILNAPSRVLRRYDLLKHLHDNGTNDFRAYRLHEERTLFRYPVFLRLEREHQGNLSPLLDDSQAVETAIPLARQRGFAENNLLLVEYCDVRDDDGLYRKFSAFMIGDRCFPRHIIAGADWVSKSPDKIYANAEECLRQENAFLTSFPHKAQIRRHFQDSGIEYGRIDYSLKDGRIQVWEINTNPTIIPETTIVSGRRAGQEQVHRNVLDAFKEVLGSSPTASGQVPFHVPGKLKQELGIGSLDSITHPLRRQLRPVRPERVKRFVKKRVLKLK